MSRTVFLTNYDNGGQTKNKQLLFNMTLLGSSHIKKNIDYCAIQDSLLQYQVKIIVCCPLILFLINLSCLCIITCLLIYTCTCTSVCYDNRHANPRPSPPLNLYMHVHQLHKKHSIVVFLATARDCSMTSTPVLNLRNAASIPLSCYGQWNTIMSHQAGNAHFEDTWDTLSAGFNDESTGEYYIGNSAIRDLSRKGAYVLRLDMWSANGNYTYVMAEYSGFSMESKDDKFALGLENYDSGTASPGGLVRYLSGSAFSTYDDDSSPNDCTLENPSAWWYQQNPTVAVPDGESSECFTSQLTSEFNMTWALEDKDGVITDHVSIEKVVMRLQLDPDFFYRKCQKSHVCVWLVRGNSSVFYSVCYLVNLYAL